MIIDAHCHIFSRSTAAARQDIFNDAGFGILYGSGKGKISTVEDIKEYMELQNVGKVWGMGFCWDDVHYAERENELILDECRGSENIAPFMGVPSNRITDIKRYIRKWKKNGYKGIGEISFYKEGFTGENEIYLREIFDAAAEEELPINLHVNEPLGHNYPGKYQPDFSMIYSIIKDYPAVKVILAHFGGGILFYELMPEVKIAFKNVWYDTAAAPFLYDPSVYTRAASVAGTEKILFGSDFPLLSLERYEDSVRAYLDEEDAAMILGGNAENIF